MPEAPIDAHAVRASAVEMGLECGTAAGDRLVAAMLTIPPHTPDFIGDALRAELIADEVITARAAEANLLAEGVPADVAATFRASVLGATMHRYRLARLAAEAGGTAN